VTVPYCPGKAALTPVLLTTNVLATAPATTPEMERLSGLVEPGKISGSFSGVPSSKTLPETELVAVVLNPSTIVLLFAVAVGR